MPLSCCDADLLVTLVPLDHRNNRRKCCAPIVPPQRGLLQAAARSFGRRLFGNQSRSTTVSYGSEAALGGMLRDIP